MINKIEILIVLVMLSESIFGQHNVKFDIVVNGKQKEYLTYGMPLPFLVKEAKCSRVTDNIYYPKIYYHVLEPLERQNGISLSLSSDTASLASIKQSYYEVGLLVPIDTLQQEVVGYSFIPDSTQQDHKYIFLLKEIEINTQKISIILSFDGNEAVIRRYLPVFRDCFAKSTLNSH